MSKYFHFFSTGTIVFSFSKVFFMVERLAASQQIENSSIQFVCIFQHRKGHRLQAINETFLFYYFIFVLFFEAWTYTVFVKLIRYLSYGFSVRIQWILRLFVIDLHLFAFSEGSRYNNKFSLEIFSSTVPKRYFFQDRCSSVDCIQRIYGK